MKRTSINSCVALGLVALTYGNVAEAQQKDDDYDSARKERHREIADAKVREAEASIDKGEVATACRLYEIADQVDPTLMRKGDLNGCLQRLGHYADAYERMRKVAATTADAQIKRDATSEASRLAQLAPCIIIDVPTELHKIPDIEVSIDGQTITRDSWGKACTPVNIGDHTINARAPRHFWMKQTHSTMSPQTQYRVTIAPPIVRGENEPVPAKPENPINRGIFIVPSAVAAIIGAGLLYHSTQVPAKDGAAFSTAGAAFLSGAAGILGTGFILHALAEPNQPDAGKRVGLSGLQVGVMGRF